MTHTGLWKGFSTRIWFRFGTRFVYNRRCAAAVPKTKPKPHENGGRCRRVGRSTLDTLDFRGLLTPDVTKPYEFIGFGVMYVTKTYEFIGFGAMDIWKHRGQPATRPAMVVNLR